MELFNVMNVKEVKVEDNLCLTIPSFLADFIRKVDEIKSPMDIVAFWHVDATLARSIFDVLGEVLSDEDEFEGRVNDAISDDDEDEIDVEEVSDSESEMTSAETELDLYDD